MNLNPHELFKRFRLTIAHAAALAVGVMLIAFTAFTWIVFGAEPQRVAWLDYVQPRQLIGLAILGSVICGLTYWTVNLWCEQIPAKERSLEAAWKSGMRAMSNRGIRFADVPVFLMLGCRDIQAQKNLLLQSGMRLAVEPVPVETSSPIRWYIAEDCIVIGCNDVGTFAATQSRLAVHQENSQSPSSQTRSESSRQISHLRLETLDEDDGETLANNSIELVSSSLYYKSKPVDLSINKSNATPHASNVGLLDRSENPIENEMRFHAGQESVVSDEEHPGNTDSSDMFVQMDKAELLLRKLDALEWAGPQSSNESIRLNQTATELLSSTEVIRYQELLEDVCRRLRSSRMGIAPINGSLVWVNTPQLLESPEYTKQFAFALRRDVNQIRDELGVIAPLTLAMDRMQGIDGFTELVRRLGPERAQRMQLGDDCDVQHIPDPACMTATCERSLESICRSVYSAFRNSNIGNTSGNQRLIQLLFVCRGKLRIALQMLLGESFAESRATSNFENASILSGVFFTAAGDSPLEKGFASQLMKRMSRQEGQLIWSTARLQLERKLTIAICVLRIACVGLLALACWQMIAG